MGINPHPTYKNKYNKVMKGYKNGTTLYVFPQEAGAIPYVDPEVTGIAIQQENLAAWKEANSEYADIIFAYNYLLLSVQPKVWNGHEDDDIVAPTPEPQDPELAWSEDSATVTIGADDNIFPTLSNPHDLAVSYNSSDENAATIDAETGAITLVDAGSTTISAVFEGNDEYTASTVTYTLTVEAAQPQGNTEWEQWEWYEEISRPAGHFRYLDAAHTGGSHLGFSSTAEVVNANLEVNVEDTIYGAWGQVQDPGAAGLTGATDLYTNTDNTTGTIYVQWNQDTGNVDVIAPVNVAKLYGNVDINL